jgi:hypothetical protein
MSRTGTAKNRSPELENCHHHSQIVAMTRTVLASFAVCCLAITSLAGCALGPVTARQRAEAQSDLPQDHPHPPARLANAPLDPSFNKLYCYNDGPSTICSRQAQ